MDEEHNDTYKVGKRRGHQRSMFTGFQRVFLIVPLISAVAFIPSLLTSRLVQVKIIDLLAITSSICTASVLMFMPNSKPQDAELSYLGRPIDANTGPLERYIDYLNGGLTLLVLPNAFLYRGTQGVHEGFWSICVLPFGRSPQLIRRCKLAWLNSLGYSCIFDDHPCTKSIA